MPTLPETLQAHPELPAAVREEISDMEARAVRAERHVALLITMLNTELEAKGAASRARVEADGSLVVA